MSDSNAAKLSEDVRISMVVGLSRGFGQAFVFALVMWVFLPVPSSHRLDHRFLWQIREDRGR